MEIGVFEAVPASGSIGIADLAQKCEADQSLIGMTSRPSYSRKPQIEADMKGAKFD